MANTDHRDVDTVELIGDGTLQFRHTRRELLSEAAEWLHVAANTTTERPALRLAALDDMSHGEFAAIRPMITPGCTISVRDGRVWAQRAGATTPIPLMSTTGPGLRVFNAINATTSVAEMADLVAAETGWSDAQAFEFCRSAILYLVGLRICIPATRG